MLPGIVRMQRILAPSDVPSILILSDSVMPLQSLHVHSCVRYVVVSHLGI